MRRNLPEALQTHNGVPNRAGPVHPRYSLRGGALRSYVSQLPKLGHCFVDPFIPISLCRPSQG